jgi:hypothetical protein
MWVVYKMRCVRRSGALRADVGVRWSLRSLRSDAIVRLQSTDWRVPRQGHGGACFVTLTERIDRLEADATNAYDLGAFDAYDRIIDELTRLEEERES